MIRTIPTFRMPTLLLVGTLLILAALAGLPTGAWAEFRIGVWQPGGHTPADTLFTRDTADDLDALGVDLLINTPNGVGNDPTGDVGEFQAFEESIMSQWSGTGPNGPRGFVVEHAPEDHSRLGYHWNLTRYAGSVCNALVNPIMRLNRELGEAVDSLATKWTAYDGFYGYRIGHEADPCGGDGGVYNSATYDNMVTVIDSIRAYDTEHRIVAVGNTFAPAWTSAEQTAFGRRFFRPNTTTTGDPDPSPANIFMQEIYFLRHGDSAENRVQARFDLLRVGLDAIGTMVRTARNNNRKAEWHFIANVGDQWQTTSGSTTPCNQHYLRDPTVAELNAQVNMALSRGATGITYFLYTSSAPNSCDDHDYRYEGLVEYQDRSNRNQRNRRAVWNTVRTVNNTLRTLGDTLNPLTWDAGFPSNRLSDATLVDAVRYATAGRLEFGVFHDDDADYVLVVNRHNLRAGGSRTIDLRFDTQQMHSNRSINRRYIVREIITNVENTHAADTSGHIWVTQQTLAPGDARLYRVAAAPETEYAYRASQTAPLFDAAASGTPDNWSSTIITWTNAAPRVWQISRTRPQGGSWSEWGNLEKSSERPAADPVFYYRRSAGAPPTPGNTTSARPPSGWRTSEPKGITNQSVWRTERTRPTGETHYRFSTPTRITPPSTETQYAYQASQTKPLFNKAASGTPHSWSSTIITWTDTAPRVWQIRRTRPLEGAWAFNRRGSSIPWSEWGTLRIYSERPAASAVFYRRDSSTPSTPRTQTSTNISTPRDWQTTQPTATTTEGVWSTTANRARGSTQWIFTAPTQETPPTGETAPGPPRNFAAATGSPLTPGSIDLDWDAPTSGGSPTGYRVEYRFSSGSWLLGATPTLTNASLILSRAGALYQLRVRAENSTGNSGWVETTGTTSEQAQPPEIQYAYRLHTSGTTAPTFTASASGVPSGWSSSRQTPNPHARYEWRISRTRPAGGSWSNWGSATVVSTYTERQTAFRLHMSGTTAPTFTASASGVPSGWSSSRQTPNPHARYEWRISRTRPAGGSWSNWGSATVVSTYTERQTAFRLHMSGTTAPTFTASASGVPSGWSSSRQTPNPHARYEWRISRTRPAGGSWSNWGSATVVSTYTERQTAFRLHMSGTTAPTFTASASGVPSGWSSSRQTPNPHARYEWRISRTRPAGGSWSNWGSATVVSTYTERQTAFRLHTSGTTAPTFTASASGVPSGWSSSRQTPNPHERYEWRISRTRPAGGSWSNWGSATVVSTYTERQTAFRLHTSGTTAPTFTASASGVPSGWSSSRQTPNPHERYEWRISRTRPAGGSWSNWGSATVVSTYTERQTAFRLHTSGTTAPTFTASASGVPSGWSSSRQTPNPHERYEWRISRTRPAGGSWSNWGSATVVSTYTERQTAFRLHTSGTTAPTFTASASGVPSGWSSSRQTPNPHERYEWRISRTRPAGGSWSNWGSATVVDTWIASMGSYRDGLTARPPLRFVFASMSLSTALPARYLDEPARNTA